MITSHDFATVIHSLVSLLGLWVLMLLWRDYRIDAFRQRLFALRDELFDYAASGGIDFNDPAYGMLRTTLNSMIRFAHRVSFFRLALTLLAHQSHPQQALRPYMEWRKAVKSVPSRTAQQRLNVIHTRMMILMVRHLLWGSPLLFTIIGSMVALQTLRGAKARSKELALASMQFGLELLESQAVEAERPYLGGAVVSA